MLQYTILLQNDKEMLAFLMTMVKDKPAVIKTMGLIKTHASYEQNTRNLAAANKEELKATFSFPNFSPSSANVSLPNSTLMSERQT